MAYATAEKNGNGQVRVELNDTTTVAHVTSLLGRGVVSKDDVVTWATSREIALTELFPLLALLSGDEFKQIAAAQEDMRTRKTSGQFSMKLADKGGISFRGVPGTNAQFGLTLYASTIESLFAKREHIEAFIASNPSKTLSIKELLAPSAKTGEPVPEKVKLVAAYRAGEVPGATINGDTVTVRLSRK